MSSGSFDIYATIVFPIVGGIIAGIFVILIEWGFRSFYEWRQRGKAIGFINELFSEWESKINHTTAIDHDPVGISPSKGNFNYPSISIT